MLDSNDILRSSCRRKILKALFKKRELGIMNLVNITNSTYNEVDRNLNILEERSLIVQLHLGRRRIIRLKLDNEKTMQLLKILKVLNGSIDLNQLQ